MRALQSVGALLRPGGVFLGTTADADVLVRRLRGCRGLRFGNDVYSVQFGERAACKTFAGEAPFGLAYTFTLAESVDAVEEYLVHRPTLERLARDAGLQLVWWSNFHTFAHDHVDSRHAAARAAWAHRNLGGLVGEEGPEEPQLSGDEWEAAGLYAAFEFVKLPLPTEPPPPKDLSNVSPAFVDAVDVKGITLDGRIVDLPP